MRQARHEGGFALALVLWVLAGLAVVAATVASQAYGNAQSVKLLRERVQSEAALLSATARTGYIAATALPGPLSLDSLSGRLLLDGRTLRLNQRERISLQDVRGLIHLGRATPQRLKALLMACGADTTQAAELSDALADYQDADDLKHLQGAEAFEYRARGLPPPRNAPLLSRAELQRVYGMAQIAETWRQRHCDEWVTTEGDGGFNRNTAPLEVLMMDGLDRTAAQALIGARGDGLPEQLGQAQAGPTNPFTWSSMARVGRVIRVRHRLEPIEWCSEFVLELTPSTGDRPWNISHARTLDCQLPLDDGHTSRFPDVDYQLPERERAQFNVAPRSPFGN